MTAAEALTAWLERHIPVAVERAVWGGGTMPLDVATYLAPDLPPLLFVTSVRCLVFQHDTLMVLQNPHSTHIVPGGRREEHESLDQTLHRELLEECGWTIGAPRLLGCVVFHHLAPKQDGYPYPYPDFVQVVYAADAEAHIPSARLTDDYEEAAEFMPLEHVRTLPLTPMEHAFLAEALASPR